MRPPDIIRYALWGGIVATANANRRHYHMTTTWLPHLLFNTLTLLLPEIYGLLAPSRPAQDERTRLLHDTLTAMVRDNPRYVLYVAPLAAGYLLSHPRFNIYKGAMAEMRLAGFGLDALPHSATAFALAALVGDTAREAATHMPAEHDLAAALRWCDRHQALLSAAALTLATISWETGEYLMYRSELAQRGNMERINMQWSPRDMLFDCAANVAGWGLANVWHSARR